MIASIQHSPVRHRSERDIRGCNGGSRSARGDAVVVAQCILDKKKNTVKGHRLMASHIFTLSCLCTSFTKHYHIQYEHDDNYTPIIIF